MRERDISLTKPRRKTYLAGGLRRALVRLIVKICYGCVKSSRLELRGPHTPSRSWRRLGVALTYLFAAVTVPSKLGVAII